jgi:LuxR family transcriptional regulator, quorum-sensing system regulator CciR
LQSERRTSQNSHHQRRDSGLGTGYTVPANIPGELPGSCSFVTKLGQKLPRHNLLAAQLIGAFAYGAAREVIGIDKLDNPERVGLTPRQHDCLMWAMRGKTDGEIGEALGISEETVTKHLNLARAKFWELYTKLDKIACAQP